MWKTSTFVTYCTIGIQESLYLCSLQNILVLGKDLGSFAELLGAGSPSQIQGVVQGQLSSPCWSLTSDWPEVAGDGGPEFLAGGLERPEKAPGDSPQ
jgi:hypothetical protein